MERKFTQNQLVGMTDGTPENIMLDAGALIANFEYIGTLTLQSVVVGNTVKIGNDTYTAAASTTIANKEFSITDAATELAKCINDAEHGTAGVKAIVDGNTIDLKYFDPSTIIVVGSSNIIFDNTVGEWELGITDGGNQYSCEKEIRDIPFDGAKGKVKGMQRITSMIAKLTTNLKELSSRTIAIALTTGRVDTTSSTTHDIITAALDIKDSDYLKNITLIAPKFGTDDWYAFILENPLQTANFDIKTQDKAEGVAALTFEAHYDRKNLKKVPIEIRRPK